MSAKNLLWIVAIGLNAAMSVYQIWGLLQPVEFRAPLWLIAGYALTPISAVIALLLTKRR
jgi:hypothetical protein